MGSDSGPGPTFRAGSLIPTVIVAQRHGGVTALTAENCPAIFRGRIARFEFRVDCRNLFLHPGHVETS